MNYHELYKLVKERFQKNEFTLKRFDHIEQVIKMSLELNHHHQLGVDDEKLKTAALLHDYAKQYTKEELSELFSHLIEDDDDLIKCPSVWHSFVGAYLIQKDFNISDQEIIDAVKYHTTGVPSMSLLAEIIYVSDAIEESRQYENVDYYRALAFSNFKQGLLALIEETIRIIEQKGKFVHPLSYQTYQSYLKEEFNER